MFHLGASEARLRSIIILAIRSYTLVHHHVTPRGSAEWAILASFPTHFILFFSTLYSKNITTIRETPTGFMFFICNSSN